MEYLLAQPVGAVHVPLGGLVTSTVVGMGVTLLASGAPTLQAGRVSPLEALRVRGNPHEPWWIHRGWPWGIVLLGLSVAGFYLPVPSSLYTILYDDRFNRNHVDGGDAYHPGDGPLLGANPESCRTAPLRWGRAAGRPQHRTRSAAYDHDGDGAHGQHRDGVQHTVDDGSVPKRHPEIHR